MSTITGADSFPATFEGPDDGDGRDAAGVEVGLEALADRTQWLRNHGVSNRLAVYHDGDPGPDGGAVFTWNDLGTGPVFQDSTIYVDIASCLAGDRLSIDFSGSFRAINIVADFSYARMIAIEDQGGANTYRLLDGFIVMHAAIGTDYFAGAAHSTYHEVITPGTVRMMLEASVLDTSGNQLDLLAGWSIRVTRVRP